MRALGSFASFFEYNESLLGEQITVLETINEYLTLLVIRLLSAYTVGIRAFSVLATVLIGRVGLSLRGHVLGVVDVNELSRRVGSGRPRSWTGFGRRSRPVLQ